MARVGSRLKDAINFLSSEYSYHRHSPIGYGPNINWERNNVFSKFFIADITGPEIIVPVVMRGHVEEVISSSIVYNVITHIKKEVVFPIYIRAYNPAVRTADSFISKVFAESPESGLSRVTIKDTTYIGSRGCIFDNDGKLLMLCTLVGRYLLHDQPDDSFFGTVKGFTYDEVRLYIHSDVVRSESDVVCKAIMNKIMPFMLSSEFRKPYSQNIRCFDLNHPTRTTVIIDDISRFVRTPTFSSDYTDEDINNMLSVRASEVADQIKLV
jgi:hypothetical protein